MKVYMVGCFEDGTSEVQLEFDADKMFYVDFQRRDVVYTLPKFLKYPGEIFESMRLYHNAEENQKVCNGMLAFLIAEEKNPPEEKGRLTSTYTRLCSDVDDNILTKGF